ncbi:MAG: 1-deoxy-D-xylulose-5-phosphate reductoisomerase [Spirochaetaceae bacterium]|nr:1-deoxy-D-xylulose-5-phosphate reductoisomerase [Spirochaetaceae bacterium]
MKKVIILGATGSIGTTCLHSIKNKNLPLEVVGITANTKVRELENIGDSFNVRNLHLATNQARCDCFNYYNSIEELLDTVKCDIVLNGISGFSGLAASVKVLERGIDLALANKESVVAGGSFIFDLASKTGANIYPVDSEHSAIKSLLDAHKKEHVKSLIITASGGPFRTLDKKDFKNITVQQALNHPTWKMGKKITIDSSTLANKALEVIEAAYLFGFNENNIEVVVHPQSIIHSMIRMHDGAVYSQMGTPNMSLPIIEGLLGVYDHSNLVDPMSFDNLTLTFEKPDYDRFPLLKIAFDILKKGKSYAIAFNASNEVAVYAFLKERISYLQLQDCVISTMQNDFMDICTNLSESIEIDNKARAIANRYINSL